MLQLSLAAGAWLARQWQTTDQGLSTTVVKTLMQTLPRSPPNHLISYHVTCISLASLWYGALCTHPVTVWQPDDSQEAGSSIHTSSVRTNVHEILPLILPVTRIKPILVEAAYTRHGQVTLRLTSLFAIASPATHYCSPEPCVCSTCTSLCAKQYESSRYNICEK